MGTFIADKLQHLNNDLVQLFHLDSQPPLHEHAVKNEASLHGSSALSRSSATTSNSKHPPQKSQDEEGTVSEQSNLELLTSLRASIEAIDLRSGTVPPMERVYIELEKIETLYTSTASASKFRQENTEASKLEHLFLAKCTVAVYLNLLDKILDATLPLANEIQFWQSLLDNRSWRLFYIVQTSPNRLFNLTKTVLMSTREHLDSLIGTAQEQDAKDRKNHILQLIQYFPTFLKSHLISQPVSFPVAIHYEITNHRKQLQRIREYQAECLGLLAEQGLNLDPEHLEDTISSSSSSLSSSPSSSSVLDKLDGQPLTEQAEKFVQEQISKTVCLMERVLDKASKDTKHLTDHHHHHPYQQQHQQAPSSRRATRSLTLLGNLQGVDNLSTDETLKHLKRLIEVDIPLYVDQTETQARQFHRPSWLTRIWVPALLGYFGLKYGIQYVSEHRADLDQMLEEAWDTARRFVMDWVWEPTMRVMAIIRHSDDQGSLQMLGNESLKTDIASLERMVLDFGKGHYKLGPDELSSLSQAVHNGDISMVMRAYEQDIKTPFQGAIKGNLVQTFLIQIQKTKVDVEVAMAALDKLLKANELNFAFLAVGPSLLLLWAVSSYAKSVWQRMAGRNMGLVAVQMRNSLRQVERLLNLASADGDGSASARVREPLEASSSTAMARKTGRQTGRRGDIQAGEAGLSDDFEDLSVSRDHNGDHSREEPASSTSLQMTSDRLTRMRAKKGKVPYKTQGLILCEVQLLRTFAARLTRSEGLRDKVMEDLREIEESSLTVHQRLRTTKRMYRTYGFLGLHQH
ncbi:Nuclear control of ATPase protein 2 [Mortierella claussenii]|nr:Nuclear control of ATPase protein 2 [Mortierella claussenii]